MKNKKLLVLVLTCIVLAVSAISTFDVQTAHAENHLGYLNFIPNSSGEPRDDYGDGWYWHAASKTLTLNNANMDFTSMPAWGEQYGILLPDGSTVYVPDGTTSKVGIPVPKSNDSRNASVTTILCNGSLTFTGKGSLYISIGDNLALDGGWLTGLSATNLTVDGTSLNVTSGNAKSTDSVTTVADTRAISAGTVTVKGNASINATGGKSLDKDRQYGFIATTSLTILNGYVSAKTLSETPYTGKNQGLYCPSVVGLDSSTLAPEWGAADGAEVRYRVTGMTIYYEMYNAIGGKSPSTVDYATVEDRTLTVKGDTGGLVKKDHIFKGWTLDKEGKGTLYTGGENLDVTADTVFYAQWTAHVHTYQSTLSSDSTGHYYAATCEHTDVKGSFAEHNFGGWQTLSSATCTSQGQRERVCGTCSFKQTEVLPALGHDYNASWSTDPDGHWHSCNNDYSEQKDYAAHDFQNGACVSCVLDFDPITITLVGATVNGKTTVTVHKGSTVTVVPDTVRGQTFKNWEVSGQDAGDESPLVFNPQIDIALTAIFVKGSGGGGNGGSAAGAVLGIIFGLILIFLILYVLWKYSILKGKIFDLILRRFDPAAVKVCGLVCKDKKLFTVKGTKEEQEKAREEESQTQD